MQRIKVKASTNYEVVIAKDLLKKAGVEIKKVIAPCKVLIVTDDRVAVKYLDTVTNSMLESGYTVHNYVIKHGEKAKNAGAQFTWAARGEEFKELLKSKLRNFE